MNSDNIEYWSNTSLGHPFGLWRECPHEKDDEDKTIYINGKMQPNVPIAWGARAILKPDQDNPIDLLWDRQTIYCESEGLRTPFCRYLDNHILSILQFRVGQLLRGYLNEKDYGDETALDTCTWSSDEYQEDRMSPRSSCTFTLYEDFSIKVLANTNASWGYLYLIAFPQSTWYPESNYIKENEDSDFDWRTDARWTGEGEFSEPPESGTRVRSRGFEGVVLNQFIMHGYRALSVICDKVPDWKKKVLSEETHYYDSVKPSKNASGDDPWTARGKEYGVKLWPRGQDSMCYVVNFMGNELQPLDNAEEVCDGKDDEGAAAV